VVATPQAVQAAPVVDDALDAALADSELAQAVALSLQPSPASNNRSHTPASNVPSQPASAARVAPQVARTPIVDDALDAALVDADLAEAVARSLDSDYKAPLSAAASRPPVTANRLDLTGGRGGAAVASSLPLAAGSGRGAIATSNNHGGRIQGSDLTEPAPISIDRADYQPLADVGDNDDDAFNQVYDEDDDASQDWDDAADVLSNPGGSRAAVTSPAANPDASTTPRVRGADELTCPYCEQTLRVPYAQFELHLAECYKMQAGNDSGWQASR